MGWRKFYSAAVSPFPSPLPWGTEALQISMSTGSPALLGSANRGHWRGFRGRERRKNSLLPIGILCPACSSLTPPRQQQLILEATCGPSAPFPLHCCTPARAPPQLSSALSSEWTLLAQGSPAPVSPHPNLSACRSPGLNHQSTRVARTMYHRWAQTTQVHCLILEARSPRSRRGQSCSL